VGPDGETLQVVGRRAFRSELRSLQRQLEDIGFDSGGEDEAYLNTLISADEPDMSDFNAFVSNLAPALASVEAQIGAELGSEVLGGDRAVAEAAQIARDEDRVAAGNDAVNFLLNKEQCVLSHLTKPIIESYFTDAFRNQENITQVNSTRVGELVGLLNGRPNLQNFFKIENPYLSLMVPKIRLYKQIFDMENNEIVEDQKIEFQFDSFTRPSSIRNITTSGEGRGSGVGIKKATWSYEGTNPEEITTFVNFDLSLYFQSIQDLLPPGLDYSIGDARLGREIFYDTQNANLIQLIAAGAGGNSSLNNQRNPMYFTVKALVGWELSNDISMNLTREEMSYVRSVINSTDVWLELSMMEHSININDDGSITLDIRYVAGLDEQLSDDSMNILRVGISDEEENAVDTILAARQVDTDNARVELHDRDGSSEDDASIIRESSGCRRNIRAAATIRHSDGATDNVSLSEEEQARLHAISAGTTGAANIYNNYETFFNGLLEAGKVYEVVIEKSKIAEVIPPDRGVLERAGEGARDALRSAEAAGEARETREFENTTLMIEYLATRQLQNIQITSVSPIGGTAAVAEAGLEGVAEQVAEGLAEGDPEGERSDRETLGSAGEALSGTTDALHQELLAVMSNSDPYYRIKFFRLGDILDVLIGGIKNQPGNPLSVRPDAAFNFVSGVFTYFDIHGNRIGINYCDILISVSKFREFFVETVVRPLKIIYNLRNFIIDMVTKFSYVASIPTCTQGTFVRQDSRPTFSVFQSPRSIDFASAAQHAAVSEEFAEPSEEGLLAAANAPLRAAVRGNIVSNPDSIVDAVQGATGDGSERSAYASVANVSNYFIIQSTNFTMSSPLADQNDLVARERADATRGIYHIRLGSTRGLLKKISFIKDELAGRREGRITRGGGFNASVLREKYNADLTLYGCPFIYPGMYVYIDPSMIGMGFTDRAGSAAQLLGLGGYYFVNKVSNVISSNGTYETQLETIWNSFGGGRCDPYMIVSNRTLGSEFSTNVPELPGGGEEAVAFDRNLEGFEQSTAAAAGTRVVRGGAAGTPAVIPTTGRQF
jgi:hypothetical protein